MDMPRGFLRTKLKLKEHPLLFLISCLWLFHLAAALSCVGSLTLSVDKYTLSSLSRCENSSRQPLSCLARKQKLNLRWPAKLLWHFPKRKEFLFHVKQVTSWLLLPSQACSTMLTPNSVAPLGTQEKSGNWKRSNSRLGQGKRRRFHLFYHLELHLCSMWVHRREWTLFQTI